MRHNNKNSKRPVVERFEDRILATVGLAAAPTHPAEIQITAVYSVTIYNPFPQEKTFLLATKGSYQTQKIDADSSMVFTAENKTSIPFKLNSSASAKGLEAGLGAAVPYTLTSTSPYIEAGAPIKKELKITLKNGLDKSVSIHFSNNGGSSYPTNSSTATYRYTVPAGESKTATIPYTGKPNFNYIFAGETGSGSKLPSSTSFTIKGTSASPKLTS